MKKLKPQQADAACVKGPKLGYKDPKLGYKSLNYS